MSFSKKAAMFAMVMALPLAACDVDQTEEGELPEVDVREGEMPEYDVEGPEIDVREDTVTVPEVEVDPPNGAEEVPEGGRNY